MNLFSIAAASLVFSAAASAQSLNFSGIVESVPGSANRYTVACSNAELLSPDVDLMPFVNQHVHITGEWNVSYTDPIVYVEAVQAVPQIFALGGTGQIGMDLKVSFDADPGTVGVLTQRPELVDADHRSSAEVVGVLHRDRSGGHEERPHVGGEHGGDHVAAVVAATPDR